MAPKLHLLPLGPGDGVVEGGERVLELLLLHLEPEHHALLPAHHHLHRLLCQQGHGDGFLPSLTFSFLPTILFMAKSGERFNLGSDKVESYKSSLRVSVVGIKWAHGRLPAAGADSWTFQT